MKTLLFSLFLFNILAIPVLGQMYGNHNQEERHRRPGGGRPWRPSGGRPSGNRLCRGRPSSYSVNVAPGEDTVVQSWRSRGKSVWTVQSPGSTLTAECSVSQRQPCTSNTISLVIAGQQICERVGPLPTIEANGTLQISYSNCARRGRGTGFRCNVTSTQSELVSTDYDWSYSGNDGPDTWSSTYPTCGSANQSPINIETANLVGEFPWPQLGLHGYDDPPATISLVNTGRAAVLDVEEGPYIMGGALPLNERFALESIVFRWGSSDNAGSEHTVDGNSYAGEIQFIHYNMKYGSFEDAAGNDDGFAAISVFLELSQNDNGNLRPVTEALRNIQSAGSSVSIPSFPLSSLLPESFEDFYRYNGSLTQPGCDETVWWSVVKEPLSVSSNELNLFRSLQDESGDNIDSNLRPAQALNNRDVLGGQITATWSHYGPDGQDVWAEKISPDCGGDKQSPVAIETSETVADSSWPPLIFTNFNGITPSTLTVHNNDHGVEILPNFDFRATIEGGPFDSPYLFFHYHFHWGSPTTKGSEHVVDGRRYAGEMHMLIYKESLGFFASLGEHGALLEVAIFLEESDNDNPKWETFITALDSVIPSDAEVEVTPFPLGDLLPDNVQDYFFYDGALTAPVPTCSELINFMLFREPVPLSRRQLNKFYQLQNAAGFNTLDNFRQLQPLNNRTIFKSPTF